MSKLLIVNPNTSQLMTQAIKETAQKVVNSETQVDVIMALRGPEALESFYDYSLATYGVITTLKQLNINDYDGLLLACFGDPGLYALKEILSIPVVGIAEASMAFSLLLGSSFAIIAASEKAVPMMKDMVRQYGVSDRCSGVFPLGLPVLDLEKDEEHTTDILIEVGKKAVNNGADVLLLGCAGLTGFSDKIEDALGVTVIDPITAGIKALEAIVNAGMKISRCGLYAAPAPKKIIGMELI